MSGLLLRWMMNAVCAALLIAGAPVLALDNDSIGFERTPPRLSFTDGEVSFLRAGAADWSLARVNTALAAGDELYAAEAANLELQVAARAYVRAGENTQLGLTSLEPDFLQLRVTSGTVSVDLRSRKASQTLEIDTPNAAFTIERTGYYRVEVDGETTTFTSRRGGRATLTPATGESVVIAASEQVVVTGDEAPQIGSYAAPELDAWDRWNYARTDDQSEAVSARYVPADVYGVDDLDHYGDWRVVSTYGPVWVPRGMAAGWVPYSTGRWLFDPYYGWTWVDDAPWGWAPYHYGRWVRASGYWAWCPGPIVARPYYAPALVAFYGGGGFSFGVSIGTPYVGWLALGWGDPLIPWWGPARFRSYPHWAGWGGPRIVNSVVVNHTTVIQANRIKVYQNAREDGAFVKVDRNHFGRRDHESSHFERGKPDDFKPVHGDHPVRPDRSSLVAERGSARRPPNEVWKRSVVATREPRREPTPEFEKSRGPSNQAPDASRGEPGARNAASEPAPAARVVQPPRGSKRVAASDRAPFGKRSDAERAMPPPTPRFERSANERSVARERKDETPRRDTAPAPPVAHKTARSATPRSKGPQATPPQPPATRPAAATPERVERARHERSERAAPSRSDLPGEPANRVYRQSKPRQERSPSKARDVEPSAPAKENTQSGAGRQTERGSGDDSSGGKRSERSGVHGGRN